MMQKFFSPGFIENNIPFLLIYIYIYLPGILAYLCTNIRSCFHLSTVIISPRHQKMTTYACTIFSKHNDQSEIKHRDSNKKFNFFILYPNVRSIFWVFLVKSCPRWTSRFYIILQILCNLFKSYIKNG